VGDTGLTDIRPFSWRGWKSAVMYTYMLDISEPGRLWDHGIDRNIRNRVRKCRDCGIEIKRVSDVKVLYEIAVQTLERHHTTMTTNEESFCGLCRALMEDDRFIIYAAQAGSEVVSAYGVVKDYRGMLHLLVGGTRPDHLEQGPASHLLWTMIEDFAEEGFKQIDLNGANIPSIAQFKSRLGGELKPYFGVFTENRKARLFNWGWRKATEIGVSGWLKHMLLENGHGKAEAFRPVPEAQN
jgi:lipid II:glycine glycyltransferase (peptidoglycan interpeptide bridge formation enzyme)